MSFHPYLNFAGNAREAMEFYAGLFGAELTLMTFAEGPPEFCPADGAHLVMHSQLVVGPGVVLMGCDVPPQWRTGAPSSATVFHAARDEAAAQRVFAALAEGGTVTMPLAPTFWSPLYGMVTDRFGTSWMISIPDASGG